jgi:hypothetical protein
MAWSTPFTAVSNSTYTAAQHNASVRDNLLECPTAKATAAGQMFVSTGTNAIAARTPGRFTNGTAQTTASLTYTDLTTVGPAYTVTTGTSALVIVSAAIRNSTGGGGGLMSFAVSGATTIAPSDDRAFRSLSSGASTTDNNGSRVHMQTGLTAGSNTFTAKYAAAIGGTATFEFRELCVIPF